MKGGKSSGFLITSVTIAIFVLLFSRIDGHGVIDTISGANHLLLSIAVALSILINVFLASHKLGLVMKSAGCGVPIREIVFARLGSYPIKVLLPLQSGKLLKAIYFRRCNDVPIRKATGAILFDLASDLYSMLLIFFLSLGLSGIELPYAEYITVLGVLSLVATLFMFGFAAIQGFLLDKIKRVSRSLHSLLGGVLAAFNGMGFWRKTGIIFYSVVLNGLFLLTCYLLFESVGVRAPPMIFITCMSLVILISQIPVTISGLGMREASIVLLFGGYASPEELLSSGILISLVNYVLPVCLALFFMRSFMHKLILGNNHELQSDETQG